MRNGATNNRTNFELENKSLTTKETFFQKQVTIILSGVDENGCLAFLLYCEIIFLKLF